MWNVQFEVVTWGILVLNSLLFVNVCVSSPGFDLHRCQPRGVCRALLEPRPHQAGRRSSPPDRTDVLGQRALPHCQGHLWHRHVVHAQSEGTVGDVMAANREKCMPSIGFVRTSTNWAFIDVIFRWNDKSQEKFYMPNQVLTSVKVISFVYCSCIDQLVYGEWSNSSKHIVRVIHSEIFIFICCRLAWINLEARGIDLHVRTGFGNFC